MPTFHEIAARQAKAVRLAATLTEAQIDAAKARAMDVASWRIAANMAGVRMPSAETQAAVLVILEQQEVKVSHG